MDSGRIILRNGFILFVKGRQGLGYGLSRHKKVILRRHIVRTGSRDRVEDTASNAVTRDEDEFILLVEQQERVQKDEDLLKDYSEAGVFLFLLLDARIRTRRCLRRYVYVRRRSFAPLKSITIKNEAEKIAIWILHDEAVSKALFCSCIAKGVCTTTRLINRSIIKTLCTLLFHLYRINKEINHEGTYLLALCLLMF